MSYCSHCGKPLNQGDKFCPSCGNAIPQSVSAPVEPVYTAPAEPVYTAPVYAVPTKPVISPKAKVLGFIGMGLAIGGLVMGAIGLLYTLGFMGLGEGVSLVFAFIFGIFSFPLSIVGGVLCNNSMAMGNYSTPCSVGIKLRTAGMIVSIAMMFFGFVSLAAM